MTDKKRWSLTPKSGVFDRETRLLVDRIEVDFNGYRYFINDDRLFIHPEDVTGRLMSEVHPTLYERALDDDGLVSFSRADFEASYVEWPNVLVNWRIQHERNTSSFVYQYELKKLVDKVFNKMEEQGFHFDDVGAVEELVGHFMELDTYYNAPIVDQVFEAIIKVGKA